ncbi:MAG: AMP-binding protein [Candidatus Nanopelagicales bacterium]|nr:AMP-binding protein [Candidatus Nanopelagicales bacterium]MDZ4249818.1 AMP-binding protein [Candidatus Nanopelagicales bacterium]
MMSLIVKPRPRSTGVDTRAGVRLACDLSRFGDAPAVWADDRWLTYAEFDRRIDDAAATLGRTRRLVAVPGLNTLDTLTWALAALRGGHVLLMSSGTETDAEILARYRPDVTIEQAGTSWAPRFHCEGSAHELHPDLALLLSTSGSTGSPKLVRLSAENLDSNAHAIAKYLSLDASDRAITTLPIAYCYGLSVVTSHLRVGAGIILTDLSVVDECFWTLAKRERATSIAGVPHTFELLERSGFHDRDLPSLRRLTQAGGRMPPDRVRRFAQSAAWDLYVMYGQTEATARMAYLPPHLAATAPETVGVPIPGGSVRIDPETGELIYSGPNVMLGYAERPEDLSRGRDITELRTGDLARVNRRGLIEITGRTGRVAKIFGLRIDLTRVEAQLRESVVTAVDSRLVVTTEGNLTRDDLEQLAVRCATTAGIPSCSVTAHCVAELPRLANGKPDLVSVRTLAAATATQVPQAAPACLDSLVLTFSQTLRRRDASPDDTFVSLGGDSLSYVSMSVRLEQQLGELPRGWHLMTIRQLSERIPGPSSVALPSTQVEPGPRDTSTRWAAIETSVALRAIAIAFIAGSHVGVFDIRGGAHLMLGIAGYNFARFHLSVADRFERLTRTTRSLMRFAVPAALWMATVALLTAEYSWGLFGVTFSDRPADAPEWRYWFIEVLVLSLVLAAALTAVSRLHRFERARPIAFALALLTVAVLVREVTRGPEGSGSMYTVWAAFWVFCLGWVIARLQGAAIPKRVSAAPTSATSRFIGEFVSSALIVALVPAFFDRPIRGVVVTGGLLVLVWLPQVHVPRVAAPFIGTLAAASLFIYLSHWQTYPPLADTPWLAFGVAVSAGIFINGALVTIRRR